MDLELINIASNTNNNRNIKKYTHYSKLKNPLCGDEIQIELIIRNDKIVDFGYHGKSCIFCQASASLLSKISMNFMMFCIALNASRSRMHSKCVHFAAFCMDPINFRIKFHEISALGAKCDLNVANSAPDMKISAFCKVMPTLAQNANFHAFS